MAIKYFGVEGESEYSKSERFDAGCQPVSAWQGGEEARWDSAKDARKTGTICTIR